MKWTIGSLAFVFGCCAGAQIPENSIARAYTTMTVTCDSLEKQVIAREGSTEEADLAAIADIRQRCDTLFAAFDGIYELSKAQP